MLKIYHENHLRRQQRRRTLVALGLGFAISTFVHINGKGAEIITAAHASGAAHAVQVPLSLATHHPDTLAPVQLKLSTELNSLRR